MSLCNTFRLFVVSIIIVLSSTDAPVLAFTLRRATVGIDPNRDLAQEESVILEVKRDLNGKNDIQLVLDKTNNSIQNNKQSNPSVTVIQNFITGNDSNEQTTNIIPTEAKETTVDFKGTDSFAPVTNLESQTITTINSISEADIATPILFDKRTENTTNIPNKTNIDQDFMPTEFGLLDISTTNIGTNIDEPNDNIKIKYDSMESGTKFQSLFSRDEIKKEKLVNTTSRKSRPTTNWKKYTTIERKRPSQSSEEKVSKGLKEKEIIKTETKQTRKALQDTITSDIPTFEQLKNDLIKLHMSESQSALTPKTLLTEQNTTNAPLNITPSSTGTISQVGTVESKRAGFLNFSGKTTTAEVATEREIEFKGNNNVLLRSMFETESPGVDALEDKSGSKLESQSILSEDAIKEELLKEELVKDSEENAQRQRIHLVTDKPDFTHVTSLSYENYTETNSTLNLGVKPIDVEKSKNTTLYAVNPNYKPMKKIEVLPPKLFVRDPDDNSWRNESLSSLGIVFKPKNSSKPFTQVLKNKTETEWNNLPEKDTKNDIPDLKERLQKIAEKRKSRRKKLDSFGNIVYFDYEENSNSMENANSPADGISSTITSFSPDIQNKDNTNSFATVEPQNNTETTTQTTEFFKKVFYTTKKPKKFFNVPEYYDITDEDDSDYLNMAKIDLKKFTTSHRTTTPFHSPTVVSEPPVWLPKKTSNNLLSERKATVQYFPPLTTQKVNINDYDNNFKSKVESFTTETELPKNVLPVDRPTTPVTENTIEHNKELVTNYEMARKTDFTTDVVLTQPPLTTDPGLTFLNDDGSFDRGSYVIKHYKDFINEAARDSEFDKNAEYHTVPYTEVPIEGVTKTELIRYEKEKPRTHIENVYDYETQFRKDVLQRFVDSFNRNSERYKSDFPILFNNSVIHGGSHGGDVASSRAFMRGLYNSDIFRPKMGPQRRPCEPNCENLTVELSPAYELHYYVPEQEEKEEVVPQPVTPPFQYRL